jgi:hypothetical protein
LRDLLEAAVGDPPVHVTVAAVRRRMRRRRAVQAGAVSLLAAVLAAGLGGTLAAGGNGGRAPGAVTARLPAAPPRYYIVQGSDPRTGKQVLAVRARATGKVTAVIRNPLPGARCGGGNAGVAAARNQTFFMTCVKAQGGGGTGPGRIDTLIYRFRVTGSGRATGYALVRGGALRGLWASTIAAAPDGSAVAAEVLRPQPSGQLVTNTVPAGIVVINTRTGARAMWHTGPAVPGALQYAFGHDLSFTGGGRTLVVLEARCHRGRYLAYCNGHADMQVRAYGPAAAGGSLEGGQVLLRQSALRPPGTALSDAFISPGGSVVTAVLARCPRLGPCTLSVARVSAASGQVLQVLYRVRTGSAGQGYFERFFSWDPSGRDLILDAGAGNARVSGWIDHGRLVPLPPANGNVPLYESW